MEQTKLNEEMTRIYERDGKITASVFLAEQTPKTAPLHNEFEWHNPTAGHLWRLHQSRNIIRKGRIINQDYSNDGEQVVNVARVAPCGEDGKEGAYKPISVVAKSIDEYSIAYESALARLTAATRSIQALEAAAEKQDDDTIARIGTALKALEVAQVALSRNN